MSRRTSPARTASKLPRVRPSDRTDVVENDPFTLPDLAGHIEFWRTAAGEILEVETAEARYGSRRLYRDAGRLGLTSIYSSDLPAIAGALVDEWIARAQRRGGGH